MNKIINFKLKNKFALYNLTKKNLNIYNFKILIRWIDSKLTSSPPSKVITFEDFKWNTIK